jgi:hypothetical protein
VQPPLSTAPAISINANKEKLIAPHNLGHDHLTLNPNLLVFVGTSLDSILTTFLDALPYG